MWGRSSGGWHSCWLADFLELKLACLPARIALVLACFTCPGPIAIALDRDGTPRRLNLKEECPAVARKVSA